MSQNLKINTDISASTKTKKFAKVCTENWDRYIEDIIIFKHLHSMAYIDTVQYDSLNFQRNILDEVVNMDFMMTQIINIGLDFPKKITGMIQMSPQL